MKNMNYMTKLTLSAAILFSSVGVCQAQSLQETTVITQGEMRPAFVARYDFGKELLTEAWKQKEKKVGMRSAGKEDGFTKYAGMRTKEISEDGIDLYVKLEGKGEQSTVVVMAAYGYDNFLSGQSDPKTGHNIRQFLSSIKTEADDVLHARAVAAQQKATAQAQADLKKRETQERKLTQKRAGLDKELREEQMQKAEADRKLETERNKLNNLR